MVLQKRLDYGFNGYQVPPTPKAIRSARRRGSVRKNVGDSQMCAFDLLATVAGELLEGNSSLSPSFTLTNEGTSNKKEQLQENKAKVEHGDQGKPHKSFSGSQLTLQAPAVDHSSKQFSNASTITASNYSEKVRPVVKLNNGNNEIQIGGIASRSEIASIGYEKPFDCTLVNKKKEVITMEPLKSSEADIGSLDDQVVRDMKARVSINVDNNEKLPFCTKKIPGDLFGASQENIKLVSRDDDENLSGCTGPSTTAKAFRPQQYIGDQRVRKFVASKYWKATPGLKDEEHVNTYSDVKPDFHSRKISYRRRRSQRDFPFKKRKLYEYSSLSNSDEGISSEAITSYPGKSFGYDVSAPAFARSASASGHHGSFESAGSRVKLRIRSFKVPELFIEVPESATVGSLKRKVMEAVTSILGGGLRVGVLLQGKKIRDDNKTLLQTGISQDTKIDSLAFSLEPNPSQDPSPMCREDRSFLLACDTPQPYIRYPSAPPSAVHSVAEQKNVDELPDPPLVNLVNFVESEHDSAPSPPAISTEKYLADSRALVVVPGMNAEALSIVPMRKPKRSESAQRRIRRPFSVSEVEALVQAVEKLGTGRWRDVKLRAFDNAKHRTYVDLKDKWKTLVHTARISPQQRRGEPVPQELLDRVLNAHAYWSQQQAKQHLKQQSETCRLF